MKPSMTRSTARSCWNFDPPNNDKRRDAAVNANDKGQRIAVLGAGPMGLAVAYQLARDGHRPVVFEADDRVGGMTASFEFFPPKDDDSEA